MCDVPIKPKPPENEIVKTCGTKCRPKCRPKKPTPPSIEIIRDDKLK